MKLVFRDLNDLELHVLNSPAIRFSGLECRSASFALEGNLVLEEGKTLTGVIDFMADDDMPLNSFTVEDFLRYELSNFDDRCNLLLTQEPIPEPAPEPDPPTEEELLASAKSGRQDQIYSEMNNAILAGIDVETSYGQEHFSLNESDRVLLMGIYSMMQQGITAYPYHSISAESNSNNICTVYSDEDFGKIATAAFGFITFHESYANMLVQWLDRETDYNEVYKIQYGATLPDDLMDYLVMILASAGIGPEMIPGYTAESTDASEESGDESDSEEGETTEDIGEDASSEDGEPTEEAGEAAEGTEEAGEDAASEEPAAE
jgi:hypothetical protein